MTVCKAISTSTACGRMGYLGKFYFLLPKGTPVDASLDETRVFTT